MARAKAQPVLVSTCDCGAGCNLKPGATQTLSGAWSTRDIVARYLTAHGPMPVYRPTDTGAPFVGTVSSLEEWDQKYAKPEPVTRRRARGEAGAVDPERKAREQAAVAYVAGYSGSWGLPLDIRADPRWGTKHLRLSDGQIDALLAGKDRDEARAKLVDSDPRQAQARAFVVSRETVRDGFEADMQRWGEARRPFTENQLAAIERWQQRVTEATSARPTSQPGAGQALAPVEPGMYQTPDGTIWKVQLAVHGSGRPYAKRLHVDEPGRPGSFVFESGAILKLRPEHRLTADRAAAFGRLYGICCVCGATLTDEASIEAGIGPVCRGRL